MLRAAILVTAIALGSLQCEAAERVALIIGNGAYQTLTPVLPNPPRDAALIAETLEDLGFTVDVVIDGTKNEMEDALARLAQGSRGAEVTLLFYAGHGIQDQGRNYLAPVDASLADEVDLRRRFVRLDDVMDDLGSARGARILLLDACRDNDAVEALRAAVPSRSANVTRGLARVSVAAGQLVAFATQPDRVAADGEGGNSPFTVALAEHLRAPGVELRTILTRVRVDVAAATSSTQVPEVSDSLLGEIYLSVGAVSNATSAPEPTRTEAATPSAEDRDAWDSIKDTTSVAMLETFVARYPESIYSDFARARIAELTEDEEATSVDNPNDGIVSIAEAAAFVALLNSKAPVENLGQFVKEHYAGDVEYYGNRLTRAELLADKIKWFRRWSDWTVSPESDSLVLSRTPYGAYELEYVIAYRWVGKRGTADAGRVLEGRALVKLLVKEENGAIVVLMESSAVV